MRILLGLTGLKGSGKDTFAEALVANHDFTRYAFADPLKVSAAAALGCTVEALDGMKNNPHAYIRLVDGASTEFGSPPIANLTVRQFLQRYGTEAHREVFGDKFWIDVTMQSLQKESGHVVVTDARFENEQRAIQDAGGFVVRIDRPDTEAGDAHASENIEHGLTDLVVPNNGTIADLAMTARNVVKGIRLGQLKRG